MDSREYVATFDSGPLGMSVQRIHGHAVVTRLQSMESGEQGQAAAQSVTVGSIILEVVGVSAPGDEGACSKVFEALNTARRPMRVRFIRLSQLLRPVRTPLPLVAWRGDCGVFAAGRSKPVLSGMAAAAIVLENTQGTHRLELQWACAPWLALVVVEDDQFAGDQTTGKRSVRFRMQAYRPGMREPPLIPDHGATEAQVEFAIAASPMLPRATATAAPALRGPSLPASTATKADDADETGDALSSRVGDRAGSWLHASGGSGLEVELRLASRRSRLELLRSLTSRLFADELALQAEGSASVRVVMAGVLDLFSRRLGIGSGSWTPYRFVLRTDGSLQWFPLDRQDLADVERQRRVAAAIQAGADAVSPAPASAGAMDPAGPSATSAAGAVADTGSWAQRRLQRDRQASSDSGRSTAVAGVPGPTWQPERRGSRAAASLGLPPAHSPTGNMARRRPVGGALVSRAFIYHGRQLEASTLPVSLPLAARVDRRVIVLRMTEPPRVLVLRAPSVDERRMWADALVRDAASLRGAWLGRVWLPRDPGDVSTDVESPHSAGRDEGPVDAAEAAAHGTTPSRSRSGRVVGQGVPSLDVSVVIVARRRLGTAAASAPPSPPAFGEDGSAEIFPPLQADGPVAQGAEEAGPSFFGVASSVAAVGKLRRRLTIGAGAAGARALASKGSAMLRAMGLPGAPGGLGPAADAAGAGITAPSSVHGHWQTRARDDGISTLGGGSSTAAAGPPRRRSLSNPSQWAGGRQGSGTQAGGARGHGDAGTAPSERVSGGWWLALGACTFAGRARGDGSSSRMAEARSRLQARQNLRMHPLQQQLASRVAAGACWLVHSPVPRWLRPSLLLPHGGVVPGWLVPAPGDTLGRQLTAWQLEPVTHPKAAASAVEQRDCESAVAQLVADAPAAGRLYSSELLACVRWSVLRQLRAMRERPTLVLQQPERAFSLLVRAARDMEGVTAAPDWRRGKALAPVRDAECIVRGGAGLGLGLARPGSERAAALLTAASFSAGKELRSRRSLQQDTATDNNASDALAAEDAAAGGDNEAALVGRPSAGGGVCGVLASVAAAGRSAHDAAAGAALGGISLLSLAASALGESLLVLLVVLQVVMSSGVSVCWLRCCVSQSTPTTDVEGAERTAWEPLTMLGEQLLCFLRWCGQAAEAVLLPDPEHLTEREKLLLHRIEFGVDEAARTSWDVFSDTDEEADERLVAKGDLSGPAELHDITRGSRAFLRRHHFALLVARFMPVLADAYGAGAVFDALTEEGEQVTISAPATLVLSTEHERLRVAQDLCAADSAAQGVTAPVSVAVPAPDDAGLAHRASDASGRTARANPNPQQQQQRRWWRASVRHRAAAARDLSKLTGVGAAAASWVSGAVTDRWTSWRTLAPLVREVPLAHDETAAGPEAAVSRERVLGCDAFRAYVAQLGRILTQARPKWEALRDALQLDSKEMLIRSEDYAGAAVTVRATPPVYTAAAGDLRDARRALRPLRELYGSKRRAGAGPPYARQLSSRGAAVAVRTSSPTNRGAINPRIAALQGEGDRGGVSRLSAPNDSAPASRAANNSPASTGAASPASLASGGRSRVPDPMTVELFDRSVARAPRVCAVVTPNRLGTGYSLVGRAPAVLRSAAPPWLLAESGPSLLEHPLVARRSLWQWVDDGEKVRLRLRRTRRRAAQLREGEAFYDNTRGWGIFTDSEANSDIERVYGASVDAEDAAAAEELMEDGASTGSGDEFGSGDEDGRAASGNQKRSPAGPAATNGAVSRQRWFSSPSGRAGRGGVQAPRPRGASGASASIASTDRSPAIAAAKGAAAAQQRRRSGSDASGLATGAHAGDKGGEEEEDGSATMSTLPSIDLGKVLQSAAGQSLLQSGRAVARVSGTLFLSDRAVYLARGSEVLVLPIASMRGRIEYCETQATGFRVLSGKSDNGLHVARCAVSHVLTNTTITQASIGEDTQSLSEAATLLAAAREVAWPQDPPLAVAVPALQSQWVGHGEATPTASWHRGGPRGRRPSQSSPSQGGDAESHQRDQVTPLSAHRSGKSVSGSAGRERRASSIRQLQSSLRGTDDGEELQLVPVREVIGGSVQAEATITFSRFKDAMLSRGEERRGGRRAVVKEALEELLTASQITASLKLVPNTDLSAAAHSSGMLALGATAAVRSASSLDFQRLRSTLSRRQIDAAATQHRLALLSALNAHRTRAVFKVTGRCIDTMQLCTNAAQHLLTDPAAAATTQSEVVSDVDSALAAAQGAERPHGLRPDAWAVAPALRECLMVGSQPATGAPIQGSESNAGTESGHRLAAAARVLLEEAPVAVVHVLTPQERLCISCEDGQLLPRFSCGASDAIRQACAHALAQTRIEAGGSKLQHGTVAVASLACEATPLWLLHAAAFAAHDAAASARRHKAQHTFTIERFRNEWGTMVQSLFTPVMLVRNFVLYLWAWESPGLSAAVVVSLLALCWFDLLQYALPISMVVTAAAVVGWQSLNDSLRHIITSSLQAEADSVSSAGGGFILSLRRQITLLSLSMGTGQFRIGKLNLALAKIKSLYTWADPARTRFFVAILVVLGIVLALVPSRIWFALVVIVQFLRPLRDPAAGVFLIAFNRFVDGLPVPSTAAAIGTACVDGAGPGGKHGRGQIGRDPPKRAIVSSPATGVLVQSLPA